MLSKVGLQQPIKQERSWLEVVVSGWAVEAGGVVSKDRNVNRYRRVGASSSGKECARCAHGSDHNHAGAEREHRRRLSCTIESRGPWVVEDGGGLPNLAVCRDQCARRRLGVLGPVDWESSRVSGSAK